MQIIASTSVRLISFLETFSWKHLPCALSFFLALGLRNCKFPCDLLATEFLNSSENLLCFYLAMCVCCLTTKIVFDSFRHFYILSLTQDICPTLYSSNSQWYISKLITCVSLSVPKRKSSYSYNSLNILQCVFQKYFKAIPKIMIKQSEPLHSK